MRHCFPAGLCWGSQLAHPKIETMVVFFSAPVRKPDSTNPSSESSNSSFRFNMNIHIQYVFSVCENRHLRYLTRNTSASFFYYIVLHNGFQGQFHTCLEISLSDTRFHTYLTPFVPFIFITELCWFWRPNIGIHHRLFEIKVIHSLSAHGMWTSVFEYDLTFK